MHHSAENGQFALPLAPETDFSKLSLWSVESIPFDAYNKIKAHRNIKYALVVKMI